MESNQALRTLQKKRTSNFREDETKALIELWGSPQIQKKLYLTHRKAPVMRMIAANMQQRGFYRTPDEIKTRIRNLKCLYHRIKRTMRIGAGLGTVDPDWPHFKAMDDILNKPNVKHENIYKNNIFEGPRCEDIKLEIDDIDINDDMESYTTSFGESDYEEETTPMPPLIPAPTTPQQNAKKEEPKPIHQILPKPAIVPKVSLTSVANVSNPSMAIRTNATSSLPFPLLILNGVPPTQNMHGDKKDTTHVVPSQIPLKTSTMVTNDMTGILKNLLDVQKDSLEVAKQRLELDKQKLEFERLVGTQLLTLLPMVGGLLQRLAYNNLDTSSNDPTSQGKNGRKRGNPDTDFDILKDSKILRNVLEQGIKKYMLGDDDEDNDSENEDSGVQNDDNSNSSK